MYVFRAPGIAAGIQPLISPVVSIFSYFVRSKLTAPKSHICGRWCAGAALNTPIGSSSRVVNRSIILRITYIVFGVIYLWV